MFTNLCLFLFSTSSLCVTAFGLYYLYDKQNAKVLTYRIGWKSLEYYTKCKSYYYININPLFLKKSDNNKKKDTIIEQKPRFILHNVQTDKYETHITIPDEIEYDWLMVQKYGQDGLKYKTIKTIDDAQTDVSNIDYKPFLQIEMEQNGKKIEIQDNLNFFFLENNKILDKKFLIWYVKFFYHCDLYDDYQLHIIDNDVNLFTLNQKQYIVLEKNNYIIKDN